MRLLIITLIIVAATQSCKKNSDSFAPTETVNEMVDTTGMLKYSGTFTSGPFGTVTGKAEVYLNGADFKVKLANFNTNNGPALHVYLSKEAMPINYIDLGVLKSTNGNQVYNITGMPDFMDYKYISIHCVAFNHLFGSALIQ
jgi:Electron transfer DM13